ncbi:RDD family protein [Kineosporiaceae bacterium B12]|nr:RDD family protein [Kineococcus rubinsiae]
MADAGAKGARAARDGDPGPVPGVRLGLPAAGRGSVAGWGRRFLGLLLDWVVASLIARVFVNGLLGPQFGPLAVFALMHVLLVSTLGTSLGHFAAGLVVRRLDAPRPVGLLRGVYRTLLLCLVIPAVISDADRRGLHDKGAQTVVVRR